MKSKWNEDNAEQCLNERLVKSSSLSLNIYTYLIIIIIIYSTFSRNVCTYSRCVEYEYRSAGINAKCNYAQKTCNLAVYMALSLP